MPACREDLELSHQLYKLIPLTFELVAFIDQR
jgi:hypothetical protein